MEEFFRVGGAEAALFGACDRRAEGGKDHDVCGGFGEDVFEAFGSGHGWSKTSEEQNTQTVGTSGRIAAILDTVRFKGMEYVRQLLTDQNLCRREIGDQEQKDNWNWRSVRRPAKSSADVTSEVRWGAFRKRTGLKAGKVTCNG